jgi:dTDP-glucose 4,6-dehydratase
MPRRCLISGISGFLGHHILDEVLTTTNWEVVGIASWKHKGIPERILDSIHYQKHKDRVTIITHDLTAPITAFTADRIGHIDYVIHAAAESHVDRSITDPVPFINNNVNVTINMLEWARVAKPDAFIQVSTDETYGPAHGSHSHVEWEPAIPSNPYAASKAAQEAIAISYWRTYGVPVIITNTMNLIGERQDKEKFVPMVIKKVLSGDPMTIHVDDQGKPGSRHYIHCRNQANALVWLLQTQPPAIYGESKRLGHRDIKSRPGDFIVDSYPADRPDRYHIAGQKEIDNLKMAQMIAEIIGKPLNFELVNFHASRPGHDPRYSLDSTKIHFLGWEPPIDFKESLERTVKWMMDNEEWLK